MFASDHRETNPGLHKLYVEWAITHLVAIKKALKSFYKFSNCNMNGPIEALEKARDKLIEENAAYAEAARHMEIARTGEIPEPGNSADEIENAFEIEAVLLQQELVEPQT